MWSGKYWASRYWNNQYWPTGGQIADLLELVIDGVVQTKILSINKLNWTEELERRKTATMQVRSLGPAASYFRPLVGQTVEIVTKGITRFAGSIDKLTEIEPHGAKDDLLRVKMRCVGFEQIFDRFVVARIYEGFTAGDIIQDAVSNFIDPDENLILDRVQDGEDGVQTGLNIEKAVFGFRRMSDVMRDLANLTGFSWFIDVDKRIKFINRATFTAPFTIFDGSKNYRKPNVQHSRTRLRNEQFIRAGDETTDERTEDFIGDGTRQSFDLIFRIADVVGITLDTGGGPVAQTFGIREEDNDADFLWFFRPGERSISQRDTDTPIADTAELKVTYKGLFPIIVLVTDAASISERSGVEGNSGRYQNVEDDDAIQSTRFAEQKAIGLLSRFSDIPTTFKFETDSDIEPLIHLLRLGQLISVNLPNLGPDMVGTFLVDNISVRDIDARILRYTVTVLSGEHLGGWARFFQRAQEAGRSFSLREGEKLQLLNQRDEGLLITEAFNATDALIPSDDDDTTGWVWGKATWGKSLWGKPNNT